MKIYHNTLVKFVHYRDTHVSILDPRIHGIFGTDENTSSFRCFQSFKWQKKLLHHDRFQKYQKNLHITKVS